MPRNIRNPGQRRRSRFAELSDELAEELRNDRKFGQPVIDEEHFQTGAIRVNVFWDKWERVPLEERSETIVRAYERAESKEFCEKITLATGLTLPEAHETGLLPYQVIPAVRRSDSVTLEQCQQAMIEEGASVLLEPENPRLWLATQDEAEAAQKRLVKRLPDSEQVWVIAREVGRVADFVDAD